MMKSQSQESQANEQFLLDVFIGRQDDQQEKINCQLSPSLSNDIPACPPSAG